MNSSKKLVEQIEKLKSRHHAVILAHNYQLPEVQDMADFSGDSLELSRKAAATPAEVIVFCGVHFMAETAALLSPQKTVLIPDDKAGCPMADMAKVEDVVKLRQAHPDAIVVTYVNSSAAVKAVSHVCCTSANAVEIVNRIPRDREIIFVPDQYLGKHAEKITKRKMIHWSGYCPTHVRLLPEHIEAARETHPDALVMVHPECRPDVGAIADEVLSTGGMCRFASTTPAKTIIVGTENGLLHRLRKENPDKQFIPLHEKAVCPNMKLTNLEKVIWSLETFQHKIEIPTDISEKARASIVQMLEDGPIEGDRTSHG